MEAEVVEAGPVVLVAEGGLLHAEAEGLVGHWHEEFHLIVACGEGFGGGCRGVGHPSELGLEVAGVGLGGVGTVEDGGEAHLAAVAEECGKVPLGADAVGDGGVGDGIDGPDVVLGVLVPSAVGVVLFHLHVAVAVEAFGLDAIPAVGDVGEGLVEVEVDVGHAGAAIGGDGVGAAAAPLQAASPSAAGVELGVLDEGCAVGRTVGCGMGEVDVAGGEFVLILVVGVVARLEEGEGEVVPAGPVGAGMLRLAHSHGEAVVGHVDGEGVGGVVAPREVVACRLHAHGQRACKVVLAGDALDGGGLFGSARLGIELCQELLGAVGMSLDGTVVAVVGGVVVAIVALHGELVASVGQMGDELADIEGGIFAAPCLGHLVAIARPVDAALVEGSAPGSTAVAPVEARIGYHEGGISLGAVDEGLDAVVARHKLPLCAFGCGVGATGSDFPCVSVAGDVAIAVLMEGEKALRTGRLDGPHLLRAVEIEDILLSHEPVDVAVVVVGGEGEAAVAHLLHLHRHTVLIDHRLSAPLASSLQIGASGSVAQVVLSGQERAVAPQIVEFHVFPRHPVQFGLGGSRHVDAEVEPSVSAHLESEFGHRGDMRTARITGGRLATQKVV